MHVAVDGWDVAVRSASLDAWRTLELLEVLPAITSGWQWSLIHPEAPALRAPAGVVAVGVQAGRSEWGRLRFEQFALPSAARHAGADVILTFSGAAALSSQVPYVAEGPHDARPAGTAARLRRALRLTAARETALFTWNDLPAPAESDQAPARLSPWVAPRFRPHPKPDDASIRARLGLDDSYVLSWAESDPGMRALLGAWSWVQPSVGDSRLWVIAGLDEGGLQMLRRTAGELGLEAAPDAAIQPTYADLPAVLRGASAMLAAHGPTGDQGLRWALTCGVPVAAFAVSVSEAILGEAAYLTPERDTRRLGAACLSLLVDEDLSSSMRQTAAARAEALHADRAPLELVALLRQASER